MKIQIFKKKDGSLGTWCAGSASYSTKFDDQDGLGTYEGTKEEREISEKNYAKLSAGTHEIYLEDGAIKISEKQTEVEKRATKEKLLKLSDKLEKGTITDKEVKDTLAILLKRYI